MIKIITIVGARPQIIKAAALSRTISNYFSEQISEYIIHTGQHYDANMSQVFFEELGIPEPHLNLNIGSAPHGKQTALMLEGIETAINEQKPDYVVLYGDTNSTLAGALAASKLHVPVVHIEAGLRSYNKSMPEELNRIMCDHCSTLLFVPTKAGIANLEKEGFSTKATAPYGIDKPGIFHCGDIMFDNLVHFSQITDNLRLTPGGFDPLQEEFILCTIHRDNNTDVPERLNAIFEAMQMLSVSKNISIVLPVHPRTSKLLKTKLTPELYEAIIGNPRIYLIPPASYLEMIALEKNARLILTDSGGVQKEAYFFKKPLVVARPETEWVEIIENGAGIIADADTIRIIEAVNYLIDNHQIKYPDVFGDGKAAHFICSKLIEHQNAYSIKG